MLEKLKAWGNFLAGYSRDFSLDLKAWGRSGLGSAGEMRAATLIHCPGIIFHISMLTHPWIQDHFLTHFGFKALTVKMEKQTSKPTELSLNSNTAHFSQAAKSLI